jgi:hypothetical protein
MPATTGTRRLVRFTQTGVTVQVENNRSPLPAPTRVQGPKGPTTLADIKRAREELLSGVPCAPAIVGSGSRNWRGSR